MGGGNIDPFYNAMHSSGSEASSTVESPTLHTSNDEPDNSPTDVGPEPKYPNVAFTTRAPNGVETRITMAMEKPGVCGGPFSTKLSLDIPRIDVSRITIGPKDNAFVLYAVDGRQTTLSVSGEVTYDIQLLDSEGSAAKYDETIKSAATHSESVPQENEATPVPPQATSPAPSHATTALDAAELLQSLRSLLATPHVRAPRTRNQVPVFDGDVERDQPRDLDGTFIYSQDVHPASRPRKRRSHTLLRRPSQEFLTVPSPEIGLFATPVNVGRGQPVDTRGRPADVRSALRSVLSLSRTGSMASERDVRFEDGDPYADHRETQEYHVDSHIQERTVSFGREERMPSPEPEQYPSIHIHDPWSINMDGHRGRYRISTPLPGRGIQTPSPPSSPVFESPTTPSIRLQAPTPLVGGQRSLGGGQPPLMAGVQISRALPTAEGRMASVEQERRETPLPAGFVPSGPSPLWNASAMQHMKAAARQGQYERVHKHSSRTQQDYLAADNNASAAKPLTTAQRPSTAQTNFFSERYGRNPNQAQSQSDRTTQLLAPTMTGSQYGFATSPYGPSSAPYGLSSAPYGLPSAPNGFPTAPYSNWTPYTGALGQGPPLTPLGITPNFNSVSPGFPLPPMTSMSTMTNLSSMPMLLPVATGTGASPNTQWYTPASCSLLAPPTGAMASSPSTSNPSPNVHGPSYTSGAYVSSPNTLAPRSNVYGAPSSNVYGGSSSNSHGPPSPNASVPRTAYASSSTAAPMTSACSAPAHLCHAPWLAPQSLAATPTRLVVPSATYASSSATHRSPSETRHEPTSSHRGPPPTPFTAFTSPYAIAMPDQPEPVIPERPSLEPQTPYRSFTPTSSSSPSPTPFARLPFPKMVPPFPPSPEPVEEREDNDNSGWASSWVDPHAGWGEGDAYAGWGGWVLGNSTHPGEREERSTAGSATANDAQGSTSLYAALFGSPEHAHEPTSGGHATTDKKVAFARISESDWYPQ